MVIISVAQKSLLCHWGLPVEQIKISSYICLKITEMFEEGKGVLTADTTHGFFFYYCQSLAQIILSSPIIIFRNMLELPGTQLIS